MTDMPAAVQAHLGRVIRSCANQPQLDHATEWVYRLSRQKNYNTTHTEHFLRLIAIRRVALGA